MGEVEDTEQTRDVLLSLYEDESSHDVLLLVGDEEFPSHRQILKASSPYFASLFSEQFIERDADAVKLQGICPKVFRHLHSFIYTGKVLCPTLEILLELYILADMYCFGRLCKIIEKKVHELVTEKNALSVIAFADQYELDSLHQTGLERLIKSPGLYSILDSNLGEITLRLWREICDQDVLPLSEMQLLILVSKGGVFEDVKDKLRWGILYLNHLRDDKSEIYKRIIYEQENGKLFSERREKTFGFFSSGKMTFPLDNREDIVFDKDGLDLCTPVSVGSFLFLVGGKTKLSLSKDIWAYEMRRGKLHQMAPMRIARHSSLAISIPGKILVIGGRDKRGRLTSSVEEYDIYQNKWKTLSNIPVPTSNASGCYSSGKIYVLGGHVYPRIVNLSIFCYDIASDHWSLFCFLPFHYSRVTGVCIQANSMYISCYDSGKLLELNLLNRTFAISNRKWTELPLITYNEVYV